MVNQARDGADAGLTRTLPKHLAYAPLAAELPPEEKRTPSLLAAELKGEARLPAALRRPRIVGLLNMSQYTHNVTSVVPLEEPLFQPSPPEVVFDTFEPLREYTTLLRFRNNDNVNRRIKILAPDSSAFTVEPPKALLSAGGGKVAPGMECTFKVHFAPKDAKDYYCELVCLTEREKFLVSVSVRPRARAITFRRTSLRRAIPAQFVPVRH
jgi:hydrocephalus-inducing protein